MAAVLDFNQDWLFCLDSDGIGLDKRWHVNTPEKAEGITLPHTWKKNTLKSTDNVGFYFKTFAFEDPTAVKKVILKLEKVFMQFSLWVNGVFVEEVLCGYRPAEVNLSKFLNIDEENTICIRVSTVNGTLEFEGKPSVDIATGGLFDQSPFGGIWGNANLVYWKKACILDVNLVPDYDAKKIRVETRFSNSKNFNAKLHYIITSPDGMIAMHCIETKLDKENMVHKTQFNIKEPIYWNLESPELYTVEVYLDMSFGVTKQCGMRKADVLRGDFYLNDKIIKIKGINFTPSYTITAALPQSDASFRKEITSIKDAGFNLIKSGGSPLSNAGLDICDKLGLFVIQEMPIHQQKASKEALEYARVFIDSIINSQKTHPSIMAWNLGSDNGTLMLENGTKLLKHTDKTDETRVIFSNLNSVTISSEGEFNSDTGKILAITNEKVSLYNSYKLKPEMCISKAQSQFFHEFCKKNSTITEAPNKNFGDSEFHTQYENMHKGLTGKILISTNCHTIIPDIKENFKYLKNYKASDDYKKLFATEKEFKALSNEKVFKENWPSYEEFVVDANAIALDATLNKINAFRSNEQTSGFIIENWADTKTMFSGITDITHTPKISADALKNITRTSQVIVHNLDRAVVVGSEISFNLTLLNEVRVSPFSLTLKIIDKSGKVIDEKSKKINPEGLVFPIGSLTLAAPAKEGVYTVTATIDKNPSDIGTFSERVLVMKAAKDISKSFINLIDIIGEEEILSTIKKAAKTIVVTDVNLYSDVIVQALFDAAETGTKIVFNNIKPADAEVLNKAKRLSVELEPEPSSGSNGAAYHYFGKEGTFSCIKHTRIADQLMSDVIPGFSLNDIANANIEAVCIDISKRNDIAQGIDLQTIQYGSGSICFNQYLLAENYATNVLAQHLLGTII